ncbi:MAG TPA: RluA family pseudouridine synthase [bacterium]|nr:RluA family pseudouridine synthase [bacterium]
MIKIVTIKDLSSPIRLDQYLHQTFPEYSRNYFVILIKDKRVALNGKDAKPSTLLKENDTLSIDFAERIIEDHLEPFDYPLDILFENDEVIVVNKPAGMSVHPAPGTGSETLVNALLAHHPNINQAVLEKDNLLSAMRPGLVHRLDKDTTGVMIIAKTSRALHSLSLQIQHRDVKKIYLAICYGWPKKESGNLLNYLGRHPKDRKKYTEVGESDGRVAISDYKVISYMTDKFENKVSLVEFSIKTGRTHQIRVQSKLAGFPVLGDEKYFSRDSSKASRQNMILRQMLHAHSLTITLPGDKKKATFVAPLPFDFNHTLEQFHT